MTTQSRQPVLRCALSNAAYPEYDQATTPFPIPVMECECTLECLAAMGPGARLKWDCRVDELESGFPILEQLERVRVNPDEMDYLAQRLSSFDKYEAAQFQAMAIRLDIFDMAGFINLTFCYQQATVITNFSGLEDIGKAHILTINDGCLYADEQEQVDGRAEALRLILNEHGTVTPYEMVYDNGMELEQLYKEGDPFPDYLDQEFVTLLETSAGEGQSTLLILPDSPAKLEWLLCRTGIRGSSQAHSRVVGSTLPGGVISSIPSGHLSINGLNRLCRAVEWIAPEDLKTLVQLLADKDRPSQGPSLGGLPMQTKGRGCAEKKVYPAAQ